MPAFTIFAKDTGLIKRTGTCPDGAIGDQVRAGEGILVDVLGDARTQYVVQPSNASPYLRDKAAGDIVTKTLRPDPPITRRELRGLLNVLRDKHGLDITISEITAAMPAPPPP